MAAGVGGSDAGYAPGKRSMMMCGLQGLKVTLLWLDSKVPPSVKCERGSTGDRVYSI